MVVKKGAHYYEMTEESPPSILTNKENSEISFLLSILHFDTRSFIQNVLLIGLAVQEKQESSVLQGWNIFTIPRTLLLILTSSSDEIEHSSTLALTSTFG